MNRPLVTAAFVGAGIIGAVAVAALFSKRAEAAPTANRGTWKSLQPINGDFVLEAGQVYIIEDDARGLPSTEQIKRNFEAGGMTVFEIGSKPPWPTDGGDKLYVTISPRSSKTMKVASLGTTARIYVLDV